MEKHDEASYGHVLKYTGLFGGVQGLIILIGLVRNKFSALLLGASGMGLASLLNSVQNFASQCTNLGISFGAVPRLSELYEQQDVQKQDYYIKVIRLWSFMASLLGFVFCIAVSPLLNNMTFTWGNHTHHYAFLALAVAMTAISAGETAILKATRRLGALAKIQVYTALASVVVSIPLYYFFYHSGVLPVIVLIAAVSILTTICYSYHYHPLRLEFNKGLLREGASMIKLGIAFVIAAAVNSASEMLIRSFLNVEGDLNEVGLYNVGYMMTMVYAGMVFTAMESDYFPRLSAVNQDISATNETTNRQIEVSLLMLSPMLAALLMFLPVLIPLLFSREFMPVVGMAQVALLAMYFKVVTLPVAYITLARGYSLSYLFLETAYCVFLVVAIVVGYRQWGIFGTGMAIVAAHVFDFLLIYGYAYWNYSYRCTWTVARYALIQSALGLAAFAVTIVATGCIYWIAEAALTLVSTAYSVYILRQKTQLWEALKRKLRI